MRYRRKIVLFTVFDDDQAVRSEELFLKNGLDELFMETQMVRRIGKNEVVLHVFGIATINDTV